MAKSVPTLIRRTVAKSRRTVAYFFGNCDILAVLVTKGVVMRKLVIMTIDTETATLTGGVYDLAFVVHNKKGEIVERFSAVVRETATDADKMMGAYYARKMFTHYLPLLAGQEIPLMHWSAIVNAIRSAITRHSVSVVAAYNLAFDRRVIKATHRHLGFKDAIVPHHVQQLDIWEFACRAKLVQKKYRTLARSLGWVSEAGNIKTTAECAYRYTSGNHAFNESHTALHDAEIESEILAACYAAKGKVPYGIITGQPWKLVNAK